MKLSKYIFLILLFFVNTCLFSLAQAPAKVSYQSIIRDATGELARSQLVGIQISILQGSISGTAVYIETHTPTTNVNGLASVELGNGTPVTGSFSAIDWSNGPFFLKVETDPAGGTTYTISGITEILCVPYALYAKTAKTAKTEKDPNVPVGTQIGQMQYWNGAAWVIVATTEDEGATLQMIGGVPTWVGETPPATGVTNPTTGEIWMDRNLGASQVATSITDADAYGDLYQWGRGSDWHENRNSGITKIISTTDNPGHSDFITNVNSPYDWRSPQNDNLWQGVNGTNNPCPSGFRLPTEAEWEAERASWSSNDANGAFSSPLKLSMAGYRYYSDGLIYGTGSEGIYWSSTVFDIRSRLLDFSSVKASMKSSLRGNGFSVRCIKN